MKLFVTGGTGFLGSYFLKEAIHEKFKVQCLRRNNSKPKIDLSNDVVWIENPSKTELFNLLESTTCFVHFLAAGVTPQPISWETAIAINVVNSFNLWMQAAEAGVKRFIICGSASEYGKSCERFEPIPANAPLEPIGPYATSKAASSIFARALSIEFGLELVYIRPFNLYGPGQYYKNFWPALQNAAINGEDFKMTEGKQVRDFSPVVDAAKFFLSYVKTSTLKPGEPQFVNFGSGAPKPLIEYAKTWWKEFGATGSLLPGFIPNRENESKSVTPMLGPAKGD